MLMIFRGLSVYISKKDSETLYHLVNESGLPDSEKNRLFCKVLGVFLNDETQVRSEKLLAKRDLACGLRWTPRRTYHLKLKERE